jgi:hypothetical protein
MAEYVSETLHRDREYVLPLTAVIQEKVNRCTKDIFTNSFPNNNRLWVTLSSLERC